MMLASTVSENMGAPPASSSRMICSRMLRVRSSPLLASLTTTGSLLITRDRKSTRLNSSHTVISYAVFCLKKKKNYRDSRNHRTRNLDRRHQNRSSRTDEQQH